MSAPRRSASRLLVARAVLAGCMVGPDYKRPAVDAPERVQLRAQGRRRHRQHRVVEAVRRPGARPADRRGARQQPEREGRGRQRRAGRRRAHADALAALSAGRLRRQRRTRRAQRVRPRRRSCRRHSAIRRRPTRRSLSASWEIDLWGRIRRLTESARAQPAGHRRGAARRDPVARVVRRDQLPARCAASTSSSRSRSARSATYDESVRLFELQFKYGQVSQMNVAQAQSQYETAAAQIPLIESQIAQTENALSVLLGRNPGPIPRGKSVYELALPSVPAGVPSAAARAPPGSPAGRGDAHRRQRADRRRARRCTSRRSRSPARSAARARPVQPVHRTRAGVELRGSARRADLHLRRGQRPGRAGRRPRRRRRSTTTSYSIQNAFADVENALVANQKLRSSSRRRSGW